ncbi:ArnT family glycosyltransferase [Phyllobacterium myrsinacearum]|uniref:4-amino-4-deoxy-L-arabinose transferase-like glycosyltransferase n=1 Tax=Phyllobacterium myrsinacearum TaxID=28101 RepID=A0A839EII5_9HYPH|nr:glycosyltransferase family 39 protein [Phyllobacterium myrsinacearum]MBA8878065.1 4-amino-4-deoxy-L-arabinose transferase-like glycosyltransferase [Phyllobacterium myrsinacearum]
MIDWTYLARRVPVAILCYTAGVIALRLALSPFLDIDEAQFVGSVDFAWIYGNSHPPLYNWLVRLGLTLTGWNWVAATVLVRLCLLGLYHWLSFDTARRLGGDRAGVLALAASALLPQIVWMSIQTTAHTLLVIVASIGVIHALTLIRSGRGYSAYVWLGVWAAIGGLAKYNFFIFLFSFLIACALNLNIRRQVFRKPAWISLAIFVVAMCPIVVASLNAPLAATAGRMAKLNHPIPMLQPLDLPWFGVDGVLSLVISAFLWSGPALLIFLIGRRKDDPKPAPDGDADVRKVLFRTIVIGLTAFGLIVFFADYHSVAERYMAPILAPTAILLALYFPQKYGARNLLVISAGFYLLAPTAFAIVMLFGAERLSTPFDAVAGAIRAQNSTPARIAGDRQDDGANVAVQLNWPPASGSADDIVLVWRGDDAPNEDTLERLPADAVAAGPVTKVVSPLRNFSGRTRTFSFQRYSSHSPLPDQNTGG